MRTQGREGREGWAGKIGKGGGGVGKEVDKRGGEDCVSMQGRLRGWRGRGVYKTRVFLSVLNIFACYVCQIVLHHFKSWTVQICSQYHKQ